MFLLFSFFYLGINFFFLAIIISPSSLNTIYKDLGADLPGYTQLLLDVGWYFESIYVLIVYFIFFVAFYIFLYFTNRGKIFRDSFYHKFKISPQSVDKIGKLIFFIFLPLLPLISYLIYLSLYKPITSFGDF